jgi:hypothetical protein
MAELTGRGAVAPAMRTIGVALGFCLGFPAHAQHETNVSSARWARIQCSAWCNRCQPTYACYQDCARRGSPLVWARCGPRPRMLAPQPPRKVPPR